MKKINIKTAKMLLFCSIGIAAIFVVLYINEQRNTAVVLVGMGTEMQSYETEGSQSAQNEIPETPQSIIVSVTGEVYSPGVFEFHEGARINDAILAAGGMTPDADPNAINLAARLVDEQHIVVFSFEDNMPPSPQVSSGASGSNADGKVNINTATSEQLQTLSGIGPVTAANIISHREARGGFAAVEEIMNVSGIGERTFENIRDSIIVN